MSLYYLKVLLNLATAVYIYAVALEGTGTYEYLDEFVEPYAVGNYMYEYSMYPDTSTGTHLFIRRVPVLRPRTAGTSILVLNLVCTGTF